MTDRNDFVWRPATLADAESLAQAAAQMFNSAFAKDNTPQDMRAYADSAFATSVQTQQILDPFFDTLLLHDAEGLIGYAQIDYGPAPESLNLVRPAGIRRFYLVTRVHGRGAAQVLLDATLQSVLQRGAQWIWLGVWEKNARAIAYYKKNGFVERADTQFMLGTDLQRDLLMVRASQG